MKKLIFLLLLCVVTMFTTNIEAQIINYPFGGITTVTSTADSLTLAVAVSNQVTYVDISAGTLDTNLTINVTPSAYVIAGAVLYIETTADASNRTVTFGTNLESPSLTNTASKTFITAFVYNGTTYKAFSQKQND